MKSVGVIGGSGLDNPDILADSIIVEEQTDFGPPSGPITCGTIGDTSVAIIGRHGPEHTIPPNQVNYRANLSALRNRGCVAILATTAVGSLREDIQRGDFIALDQFIDFTRNRINTIHDTFEPGNPIHTPMADPFDARLREILMRAADGLGFTMHPAGTVVTIEGPRFSTRAESHMFRSWGADVINMSVATECAVANEMHIPYAAVAMSTDYDCWKQSVEPVSWDEILRVFSANAENVKKLLLACIPLVASEYIR